MENTLPVSDLKNYNEVLKNCRKGEPLYLTEGGRVRFVVMDFEDYECDCTKKASSEVAGSGRSSERWRRLAKSG